ncbi:33 kDa inner dynein arm light chain, axonemal isoform X3 [Cynoglossus semilaevis]|uniref:33 kDa inner dynein arm light chain, axonemal isoform X3 n=1 Tax=Cynoglossus semilaevis TaxID=244447 RepID=UPI000D62B7BE|nr:33 kDa inner dynein arm light chain, axonemal-like isoform X3 [Cynoglossus semilaevis]
MLIRPDAGPLVSSSLSEEVRPGKNIRPPPRVKAEHPELVRENTEDILNTFLPPRTWFRENIWWVQPVSNAPGRTADVVNLRHLLETKLQIRRAHAVGICPIRRELYTQCFDEVIRQVIVMCAERGTLLACARDEIQMTIAAYKTLYQTSVAYGMRKALIAEKNKYAMEEQIPVLEKDIEDLKKELSDLTLKCETIQKTEKQNREEIKQQLEEKIEALQESNKELKDELETIITSLRNS